MKKRSTARLRPEKNSDSINADVRNSPGARLWQNIIHIPWYIGFLIIAGLLGISIAIWFSRPTMVNKTIMGGQLNIVVAPFLEKNGTQLQQSDLGFRIAKLFYSNIAAQVSEIQESTNIRTELRGPDEISSLRGSNTDALAKSAQKLSGKINAHIIVYGVLSYDDLGRSIVNVKFYISDTQFGDAQELLGENELGDPILLTGNTDTGADLEGEHEDLRNRIEIVSLVMKSIGAYVGEDFPLSLTYLEKALEDNLWNSSSGKEVIYLLAGNVESRQALPILLKDGENPALAAIKDAESYYFMAIDSAKGKGDYARAYIGLAGVENFYAIYKGRLSGDLEDIDKVALEKEEAYLDKALVADYKPETADIAEKVAFNKAQIALLRYQYGNQESYLSDADKNYILVIDAYEEGNLRVREITALSHSGLAIIARIRNDPQGAVDEYKKAIRLSHTPSLQAMCLYHIGNVYYEQKDYQEALNYYKEALDMREDLIKRIPPEQILEIERRVNEIILSGEGQ